MEKGGYTYEQNSDDYRRFFRNRSRDGAYFFEKGWNVIATMRNPESRKTKLHEKKMDLQHLDVTDKESIKKVIQYVGPFSI
jgi:hypothetical protein